MTGDDVIAIRKLWASYNYGRGLPDATVLATRDWVAYVQAMTAAVPAGETILFPTEEEVGWSWPDGVMIVFSEPIEVEHTIISETRVASRDIVPVDPHVEKQTLRGMAIGHLVAPPVQTTDGSPSERDIVARGMFWIGSDPDDTISGWWTPGIPMAKMPGMDAISESSRMVVAIVAALGHRLTRITDFAESAFERPQRRRVARAFPTGLRLLELASGASVTAQTGSTVEWSHRWMVRGHWRSQPCGPRNEQRRIRWIDPYVKGPEGLPLDVRPTIWRTGSASVGT